MAIRSWSFQGSGAGPSVPKHTPYGDKAFELPGIIEAEHFDVGGANKAYRDVDPENQGDAKFRVDEGVDIVLVDSSDASKGMAIGYTADGEWLRYTVNVTKAGSYKLAVIGASGSEDGSTVQFKVDGKDVGGEIAIATGSWQVYKQFDASEEVVLDTGSHVIQLNITGQYANVDKIAIGAEFPVNPSPDAIVSTLHMDASYGVQTAKVYSLNGKYMGTLQVNAATSAEVKTSLKAAGFESGVYMVRVNGVKNFMVNTAK